MQNMASASTDLERVKTGPPPDKADDRELEPLPLNIGIEESPSPGVDDNNPEPPREHGITGDDLFREAVPEDEHKLERSL